uniref:HORMA domain-containing protein n=1 Tax=Glossina palpalis gambiensis TaxID=67801 RepID=A0A1B0AXP8_9MUSC
MLILENFSNCSSLGIKLLFVTKAIFLPSLIKWLTASAEPEKKINLKRDLQRFLNNILNQFSVNLYSYPSYVAVVVFYKDDPPMEHFGIHIIYRRKQHLLLYDKCRGYCESSTGPSNNAVTVSTSSNSTQLESNNFHNSEDVTAIFVTTAIILNQTPIFRALCAIGLLLSFNILIASKRTSTTLFIKASKGAKGKAKPNSVIKPNCRTANKLNILIRIFVRKQSKSFQPNTEVLDVQHPAYIRSLVAPKNHNYDHTEDTLVSSCFQHISLD